MPPLLPPIAADREALARLEQTIDRALRLDDLAALDAALAEIEAAGLFEVSHTSFAAYRWARWGL